MKNIILFSIITTVYFLVRLTDINKPLDYNGWTTAHSLITQRIWYEGNPKTYYFSPVYTFNNPKDKNIDNFGGVKDSQGNYYYVSYPPLSFLLPFIIFKLLRVYPALLPLNVFSSFLHLVAAVFIYLLISLILKKERKKGINWGATTGFILYLFSPGNFWFYTNIYFVDTLMNTLFIVGVYFFLKIIWQKNFSSAKHLVILGILIFVSVYTEWLGLFFALTVLSYSIIKIRRDKHYLKIFSVTVISTSISILLTFFQYSSISGFADLMAELQSKFLIRGGFVPIFKLKSYLNIIYFYKTYYFFEILILLILSLISFYYLRSKIKEWLKDKYTFLYFAVMPIGLHYLFFFNFNSNHSFAALKSSLFLFVMVSLLIQKTVRSSFSTYVFLTLFVLGSSVNYMLHTFSNYGKYNYQLLGKSIRNNSTGDENIFICDYPDGFIEPQVLYYSQRNIRHCTDIEEVRNIISKLKMGRAVVFRLDQNRRVIGVERIDE